MLPFSSFHYAVAAPEESMGTFSVSAYRWSPYAKQEDSQRVQVVVPRSTFPSGVRIAMTTTMKTSTSSSSGRGSRSDSLTSFGGVGGSFTTDGGLSLSTTSSFSTEESHSISSSTRPPSPGFTLDAPSPPVPISDLAATATTAQTLLRVLTAQPCDAMVVTKVHGLKDSSVQALVEYLLRAPETVKMLLLKERGNVVVQLFSIPNAMQFATQLEALFQQISNIYLKVALDKTGALALTRLHEAVPHNSIYRHNLDLHTLQYFDAIINHRFGNFIVSQMIKTLNSASPSNRQALAAIFCDPARFTQISCDTVGAHIAGVWILHASTTEFCTTVRRLVASNYGIWTLANDTTGSNPLQRLLCRLFNGAHQQHHEDESSASSSKLLWADCRNVIMTQVHGAQFHRMIVASMNGRSGPQQQQQQKI